MLSLSTVRTVAQPRALLSGPHQCGGETQESGTGRVCQRTAPPGGQIARRAVPTPTPTITAGGNHSSLPEPPQANPRGDLHMISTGFAGGLHAGVLRWADLPGQRRGSLKAED